MDEISKRIQAVLNAKGASFVELVHIAGLDPAKDFRFNNLRDVDFSNCDLSGFDFTGSDIEGANFDSARISSLILDESQKNMLEILAATNYEMSSRQVKRPKRKGGKPEDNSSIPINPILRAVQIMDTHEVMMLLLNSYNPNTVDPITGYSILMIAIQNVDLKTFNVIISDTRTNVNFARESDGKFALIYAVERSATNFVKRLVNHPRININMINSFTGGFALLSATQSGDLEIVKELLSHEEINVNMRTVSLGTTALMHAAMLRHEHIVDLLLSHGADPNIISGKYGTVLDMLKSVDRFSPNSHLVKILLKYGAR